MSQIKCIKCGQILDSSTRFCPNCGAQNIPVPYKRICEDCGKELSAGSAYCPSCGCPVNVEEITPKDTLKHTAIQTKPT